MKTEDTVSVILIAIICAVVAFWLAYMVAHHFGYMHGVNQVEQYYEATGGFPNEKWLSDFQGTKFDHSEEILETLNPYVDK